MCAQAVTACTKSWKLWFALLGGAGAWAAHLLITYAIAEFGCIAGLGHRYLLGVTIVSWMLILASAVLAVAAAAPLVVSYRLRQPTPASLDSDDRDTREFVTRFGLIANTIFLLTVLAQSVPIFFYWGKC